MDVGDAAGGLPPGRRWRGVGAAAADPARECAWACEPSSDVVPQSQGRLTAAGSEDQVLARLWVKHGRIGRQRRVDRRHRVGRSRVRTPGGGAVAGGQEDHAETDGEGHATGDEETPPRVALAARQRTHGLLVRPRLTIPGMEPRIVRCVPDACRDRHRAAPWHRAGSGFRQVKARRYLGERRGPCRLDRGIHRVVTEPRVARVMARPRAALSGGAASRSSRRGCRSSWPARCPWRSCRCPAIVPELLGHRGCRPGLRRVQPLGRMALHPHRPRRLSRRATRRGPRSSRCSRRSSGSPPSCRAGPTARACSWRPSSSPTSASSLATMALAALVRLDLDGDDARRSVWYLLAFPTSLFLSAGYSESLFLLLTVGIILAAPDRPLAVGRRPRASSRASRDRSASSSACRWRSRRSWYGGPPAVWRWRPWSPWRRPSPASAVWMAYLERTSSTTHWRSCTPRRAGTGRWSHPGRRSSSSSQGRVTLASGLHSLTDLRLHGVRHRHRGPGLAVAPARLRRCT